MIISKKGLKQFSHYLHHRVFVCETKFKLLTKAPLLLDFISRYRARCHCFQRANFHSMPISDATIDQNSLNSNNQMIVGVPGSVAAGAGAGSGDAGGAGVDAVVPLPNNRMEMPLSSVLLT